MIERDVNANIQKQKLEIDAFQRASQKVRVQLIKDQRLMLWEVIRDQAQYKCAEYIFQWAIKIYRKYKAEDIAATEKIREGDDLSSMGKFLFWIRVLFLCYKRHIYTHETNSIGLTQSNEYFAWPKIERKNEVIQHNYYKNYEIVTCESTGMCWTTYGQIDNKYLKRCDDTLKKFKKILTRARLNSLDGHQDQYYWKIKGEIITVEKQKEILEEKLKRKYKIKKTKSK